MPASSLGDVPALCPGRRRTRRATRLRLGSLFRQGWVALLVALLRQEPLPEGRFVSEPWPAVPAREDETYEPQRALPRPPETPGESRGWYLEQKDAYRYLMKNLPL